MRKIFIITAVSVASVSLAGLFLFQAHAQPAAEKPAETVAVNNVVTTGPMLEIHIANNGSVLLRGVRVISLSENALRVTAAWENAYFVWEIETNAFTKFITKGGEQKTSRDARVGDFLTVTGILSKGGTNPVIDAQFIRKY